MRNAPVVIVLAGGANSRFWPLEHKTLFEFLGEPLLARHLRVLSELGCADFIIVGNPENIDLLNALLPTLPGIEAATVTQLQPLGMADALLATETLLRDKYAGRAIYVTQAHDVADTELHASMLAAYRSGSAEGYLPARRVERYFEGGYLVLDGARVTGIVEKPGAGNEPSDVIKLVADVFSDWQPVIEAAREMASSGGDDIYERALTSLLAARRFEPVYYTGPAHTIKHSWDVLNVMDYFLGTDFVSGRMEAAGHDSQEGVYVAPGVNVPPDASISGAVYLSEGVELGPAVIIQGPVYLDKGVRLSARTTVIGPALLGASARLFHGAMVNGPAFIGDGAKIGNNALVRAAMVGGGSEVGYSTEVARSYVGRHCELHTNYVGDSVLAEGVHMGSGAVTANLRLDYRSVPVQVVSASGGVKRVDTRREKLGVIAGSYAQMGINASVMPGQRIGRDAILGAGVMLERDLQDNRFVRLRWSEEGAPQLEEIDAPIKRSELMQKRIHSP
jgi:NDP-sugar pyrophosphorylase family protein